MHVRDATAEDWPAVAALLAELGRPDVRGAEDERKHEHGFAAYLARPETVALVAEDQGDIVGFVDMELRQRLNFLAPQAWIPDLVVAESARGRGVGRALLAEAERRARGGGVLGDDARVGELADRVARVLRARRLERDREGVHARARRRPVAAGAALTVDRWPGRYVPAAPRRV